MPKTVKKGQNGHNIMPRQEYIQENICKTANINLCSLEDAKLIFAKTQKNKTEKRSLAIILIEERQK